MTYVVDRLRLYVPDLLPVLPSNLSIKVLLTYKYTCLSSKFVLRVYAKLLNPLNVPNRNFAADESDKTTVCDSYVGALKGSTVSAPPEFTKWSSPSLPTYTLTFTKSLFIQVNKTRKGLIFIPGNVREKEKIYEQRKNHFRSPDTGV